MAGSPAEKAGIKPLHVLDNGSVLYGDKVVAIGGNKVDSFANLQEELASRAIGENVAITLENGEAEKRVVYVQLDANPVSR